MSIVRQLAHSQDAVDPFLHQVDKPVAFADDQPKIGIAQRSKNAKLDRFRE